MVVRTLIFCGIIQVSTSQMCVSSFITPSASLWRTITRNQVCLSLSCQTHISMPSRMSCIANVVTCSGRLWTTQTQKSSLLPIAAACPSNVPGCAHTIAYSGCQQMMTKWVQLEQNLECTDDCQTCSSSMRKITCRRPGREGWLAG